jgi:hypothetical protein
MNIGSSPLYCLAPASKSIGVPLPVYTRGGVNSRSLVLKSDVLKLLLMNQRRLLVGKHKIYYI